MKALFVGLPLFLLIIACRAAARSSRNTNCLKAVKYLCDNIPSSTSFRKGDLEHAHRECMDFGYSWCKSGKGATKSQSQQDACSKVLHRLDTMTSGAENGETSSVDALKANRAPSKVRKTCRKRGYYRGLLLPEKQSENHARRELKGEGYMPVSANFGFVLEDVDDRTRIEDSRDPEGATLLVTVTATPTVAASATPDATIVGTTSTIAVPDSVPIATVAVTPTVWHRYYTSVRHTSGEGQVYEGGHNYDNEIHRKRGEYLPVYAKHNLADSWRSYGSHPDDVGVAQNQPPPRLRDYHPGYYAEESDKAFRSGEGQVKDGQARTGKYQVVTAGSGGNGGKGGNGVRLGDHDHGQAHAEGLGMLGGLGAVFGLRR